MSTSQQQKPLQLANQLEAAKAPITTGLVDATESRHLHFKVECMRNAIKKLHSSRGRYHTQIAACDLYDLCNLKNERPTK